MPISMSLNQIREFRPCTSGWETLLKAQGKTVPDDVQIPLIDILKSNGLEDAIWCMRVNWFEHKTVYMKFVNWCADTADAAAYAAVRADAAYEVAAYNEARLKQAAKLADLLKRKQNEK